MKKQICALLCGAMILTLAGCGQQSQAEVMDTTVTVEAVPAQSGSLSSQSSYIGTISAEGTANVVSMVSGNVEEVQVAVGDTVTANQLLCVFDDTAAQINLENARNTYANAQVGLQSAQATLKSAQAGAQSAQASVQSAQAGLSSAQAGLSSAQESYQGAVASYGGEDLAILEEQVRMAQENYDNTKALFDIGAASQLEVDQANQNLRSAQAGLQAAQANINSAQAGLQQAQAGIGNAEAGVQQAQAGMTSAQASVQQAQAGVSSAQANVQAAKLGVESAEYQLTLYHLSSPISGVVEAVNVTENNFTASGSLAFVISNAKNKTVTFYVTDDVRKALQTGQPVSVTCQGRNYTGVVSEISGVVSASTGLFQVKAIISEAQDLPDGLKVEITTVTHTVQDNILVPSDALYFDNGDAYVYVIRDGAAVRTPVEIGLYTRDQIAVVSGLDLGEQVITSWSSALKDGAPVRLAGEGASGTDAEPAVSPDAGQSQAQE